MADQSTGTGASTGMGEEPSAGGQLQNFLPYRLSVTSNAVSSLIAERYQARFGLKITEWRVMAILGDVGSATQLALAKATLMDKVAVNRACKVLADRGLIVREPNTSDGRSHLLMLTDEGRAIHAEVMPLARQIEQEIFGTLSADEREALDAILQKVFAKTDAMQGPKINMT